MQFILLVEQRAVLLITICSLYFKKLYIISIKISDKKLHVIYKVSHFASHMNHIGNNFNVTLINMKNCFEDSSAKVEDTKM